jgi:hypothetical protein
MVIIIKNKGLPQLIACNAMPGFRRLLFTPINKPPALAPYACPNLDY